jgi:hypothetical protein
MHTTNFRVWHDRCIEECIQEPLFLFSRARLAWPAWTRTRHAYAVVRNSLATVVSGVEPVNAAAPERRTEYPPRWGRMSRWVRGHAGWRCELCGVRNGPPPNLLTVHRYYHSLNAKISGLWKENLSAVFETDLDVGYRIV